MTWRFHFEYTAFNDGLRLYGRKESGVRAANIKPFVLEMETVEMLELQPSEPFLELPAADGEGMLRAIMDAAWERGIRPTHYEDYRRVNDAKDAHLQDMRALVAKLCETELG
jgi:hypothetical protein